MLSYLNLIFSSILTFNFDPLGSQNHWFFFRKKQGFFKKSLFEVGIDFLFDFVPTCFHFATNKRSKSFKNRFQDVSFFRFIFV